MKQHYIDSVTGRNLIKDIEIKLEQVRSGPVSCPYLLASCENEWVSYDLSESLTCVLDGKRTFVPANIIQTHITAAIKPGDTLLNVADTVGCVGDPLVLLAEGTETYVTIIRITGTHVEVAPAVSVALPVGAMVQNLRSRVWRATAEGMHSKLARPPSLNWQYYTTDQQIVIQVITPLNAGVISHYDVYVRAAPFTVLGWDWLPEVADVPLYQSEVYVQTCEHQSLVAGIYYVTVIAKNCVGRVNVHESVVGKVETVTLS